MKQVLQGVDYLPTSAKIIHTNIKPGNIVLASHSDISDPAGVWTNFYETIGYRALEVILGHRQRQGGNKWKWRKWR